MQKEVTIAVDWWASLLKAANREAANREAARLVGKAVHHRAVYGKWKESSTEV